VTAEAHPGSPLSRRDDVRETSFDADASTRKRAGPNLRSCDSHRRPRSMRRDPAMWSQSRHPSAKPLPRRKHALGDAAAARRCCPSPCGTCRLFHAPVADVSPAPRRKRRCGRTRGMCTHCCHPEPSEVGHAWLLPLQTPLDCLGTRAQHTGRSIIRDPRPRGQRSLYGAIEATGLLPPKTCWPTPAARRGSRFGATRTCDKDCDRCCFDSMTTDFWTTFAPTSAGRASGRSRWAAA
jgi:hypothetical protein